MVTIDVEWMRRNFKYRIKRRMPLWIMGLALLGYINTHIGNSIVKIISSSSLILFVILMDEKIKQGYFFHIEDTKNDNPLEHEDITLYVIITTIIALIVNLFRRRGRCDKDD